MKVHSKVKRFFLRYLIAEVVVLLISLTIFILGGHYSLTRITNILFFAGAIPLIINIFIVFGNWLGRGNFNYQYGRSVSRVSIFERFTQEQNSFLKSIFSSFFLFLIGITTIAISFIIYIGFK